jgi:hypothetical protein
MPKVGNWAAIVVVDRYVGYNASYLTECESIAIENFAASCSEGVSHIGKVGMEGNRSSSRTTPDSELTDLRLNPYKALSFWKIS